MLFILGFGVLAGSVLGGYLPLRVGGGRDNWQLSSDRPNASRRALIEAGLPAARIARVVGKADTEPSDPDDPNAASNRRIGIVLLREPRPEPVPVPRRPQPGGARSTLSLPSSGR